MTKDHAFLIFTFSDIRRLFPQIKKSICKGAKIGAFVIFLIFFCKNPEYQIIGTFKEAAEKTGDYAVQFKQLISGALGESYEPQVILVMKSSKVLKPVAETLGLQAHLHLEGMRSRLWHRFWNVFRAELGLHLSTSDQSIFQNVKYEGEYPVSYSIAFDDAEHFTVARNQHIYHGKIGSSLQTKEAAFTCVKLPQNIKFKRQYKLTITPWIDVVENLRHAIHIQASKNSKSIYELSLSYPNRYLGASIVNELMNKYRLYIKEEYQQIAQDQLHYLETRQSEVYQKIGAFFEGYEQYLQDELKSRGVFGFEQERAAQYQSYQRMQAELEKVDFELQKINSIDGQQMAMMQFPEMKVVYDQFLELMQQRDLTELALCNMKSLDFCNQTSDKDHFLVSTQPMLSLQENNAFQGLPFSSMQSLLEKYSHELDAAELELAEYNQFEKELKRSDFDIASLGSLFKDHVSETLIHQIVQLSFKLKDTHTYSEKEALRWQADLALCTQNLKDHIGQLIKISQLKIDLFRAKIKKVHQATLDIIGAQLSTLYQTTDDLLCRKKESLLHERQVLEKKMAAMRNDLGALAEHWKQDQMLQFQKELGLRLVGGLTELVESKTVGHHLHHVASKPLDMAIIPPIPKPQRLFLMTCVGGLLGGLFAFCFLTLQTMLRGFPLTSEKLQLMGYPLLGEMSFGEPDLSLLRALSFFLEKRVQGKKVGLILGDGEDYSSRFAEYLQKLGKKVIVMRADFHRVSKVDQKGLLQALEGEAIPVTTLNCVDYLFSGGYSPYGVEMLRSKPFAELIQSYEKLYDYCLILVRSPLAHLESTCLLSIVDQGVVTVTHERVEDVRPFMDWILQNPQKNLTFITSHLGDS